MESLGSYMLMLEGLLCAGRIGAAPSKQNFKRIMLECSSCKKYMDKIEYANPAGLFFGLYCCLQNIV